MCPVIITCRSLLWTLLSIATTQIMIASVMTPQWLIGYEREPKILRITSLDNSTVWDAEEKFQPTIGIINRCTRLRKFQEILKHDNCATYVMSAGMSDSEFPDAWKASLAFFAIGSMLLVFTMGTSVISLCVQSMCGKSIFTVSGLIQSIAGLFCVLGLVIYPIGWASDKLEFYCGDAHSAYYLGKCTFGWSFYMCVIGTLLVFVSSVLSIGADRATSSRKVEDEVLEGKALICVMA